MTEPVENHWKAQSAEDYMDETYGPDEPTWCYDCDQWSEDCMCDDAEAESDDDFDGDAY